MPTLMNWATNNIAMCTESVWSAAKMMDITQLIWIASAKVTREIGNCPIANCTTAAAYIVNGSCYRWAVGTYVSDAKVGKETWEHDHRAYDCWVVAICEKSQGREEGHGKSCSCSFWHRLPLYMLVCFDIARIFKSLSFGKLVASLELEWKAKNSKIGSVSNNLINYNYWPVIKLN